MERRQRQRQRKNKEGEAPEVPAASVHDVPDDLLRLILLRLDSPLWLLRTASVCKQWRQVIADGGGAFGRLARSRHPPDVVGHYHRHRRGPIAFVPSSPPAPIDARHFSLDFLPVDTSEWDVADCHGGLVLLQERGAVHPGPEFILCNPLTRQYRWIKRPQGQRKRGGIAITGAFLLDGEDGDISMWNLRLIFRFAAPRQDCKLAGHDGSKWRSMWGSADVGQVAGRINGSLCLGLLSGGVIVLDNASMKFSKVKLPSLVDASKPDYHPSFVVVHGAAPDPTSPPTARIVHANGEGLEVFRRRARGTGEWVLERSVHRLSEVARGLPSYLAERPVRWAVEAVAGGVGFAVLSVVDFDKRKWFFTVNVDTMEVQFVPESSYHLYHGTTAACTYALPYVV